MYNYIKGDTNADGSPYLPFDDDYLTYDTTAKRYYPTKKGLQELYDIDLDTYYEVGSDKQSQAFLKEQSRNVYRQLLKSPYNDIHTENVLFKIARTKQGRNGIKEALYSQVVWALKFGKDQLEEGISPNAIDDLRNSKLWHKCKWPQEVNPAELNVGY